MKTPNLRPRRHGRAALNRRNIHRDVLRTIRRARTIAKRVDRYTIFGEARPFSTLPPLETLHVFCGNIRPLDEVDPTNRLEVARSIQAEILFRE